MVLSCWRDSCIHQKRSYTVGATYYTGRICQNDWIAKRVGAFMRYYMKARRPEAIALYRLVWGGQPMLAVTDQGLLDKASDSSLRYVQYCYDGLNTMMIYIQTQPGASESKWKFERWHYFKRAHAWHYINSAETGNKLGFQYGDIYTRWISFVFIYSVGRT